MNLVSVIIPTYNTEKFIEKCLKSIKNQTYTHIEIIIINDGSTDNTLTIIEKHKKTDNRIKLLNFTQNKGNGIGRNLAVKEAKGEYILFVDADDWVENNLIEKVVTKIETTNADVVLFGHTEHLPYKKFRKRVSHIPRINDFENHEIIFQNYLLQHNGVLIQPWIYLINRKLLIENNICFNETGVFFEDVIFSTKLLFYTKKLVAVREELYHYYRHKKSITHSYGRKTVEGRFAALIEIKQFLKQNNVFEQYKDIYSLFFIRSGFLLSCMDYFRMKTDNAEIEKFLKDLCLSEFVQKFNISSLQLPSDTNREPKALSYKQIQSLVNTIKTHFSFTKRYYRFMSKIGFTNI